MCWYENVTERIVETKLGLQKVEPHCNDWYYVDCRGIAMILQLC